MVNKVVLVGFAAKDVEVKHLENGVCVARVTLTTSENYIDGNGEVCRVIQHHNVVMWRELAERAAYCVRKKSLLYVCGKLSYWENANGILVTDIIATEFWLPSEEDQHLDYKSYETEY